MPVIQGPNVTTPSDEFTAWDWLNSRLDRRA